MSEKSPTGRCGYKITNFMRNEKISLELFAKIGNNAYLCSVKMGVLAIR